MTAPMSQNDEQKLLTGDANEAKRDEHAARAEGWVEEGEDVVRIKITKDVRWMRWIALPFAILIPIALLVLLPVQIKFYSSWLSPMGMATDETIKALAMPMTALIVSTFICVTSIYSALLLGLFRSVSTSRDKLTMADVYPILAILQKAKSASGG